ncbi:RAVE subunit 2/Rogdi [Cladorrhinum samala]|uniref:RAVE subunit 2/Rogdi n=1 Tax=Cladorrhinum samala TaxID=585594 RepID=A0AAV9HV03_9PEZI|nr:RAVE subunit 2/Rogdi [Cladorrhinum samala]
MSVEIWPRIEPDQLKVAVETSEKRELDWLVQELHETLTNLKQGLEECYALLAPIDPGCTLVLSTPRNEIVKGTITRVGTRIVKGTIHLRLHTLPHQTITINPEHPIHLGPLTTLNSLLTNSIDLLDLTLSYTTSSNSDHGSSAPFLSAQLRLLSQSLSESVSLLKGGPSSPSGASDSAAPSAAAAADDPSWTSRSASPAHFLPPLPTISSSSPSSPQQSLSFFLTIQESSLILYLRTLEPANAPVHFSTKLALAIGTARRLEHDEADRVFGYRAASTTVPPQEQHHHHHHHHQVTDRGEEMPPLGPVLSGTRTTKKEVDVYVREKVKVESADPALLSLAAKLTALAHTLALARRNLAAVMGETDLGSFDD